MCDIPLIMVEDLEAKLHKVSESLNSSGNVSAMALTTAKTHIMTATMTTPTAIVIEPPLTAERTWPPNVNGQQGKLLAQIQKAYCVLVYAPTMLSSVQ